LFFRDAHPFEALSQRVLPELVRARAGERLVKIWCAAASSGQEPYSIAMLLADLLAGHPGWRVRLLATDISQRMLARTRAGLVIRAALTHPEMVEALGHDVPRVFMLVFGAGCALAGLAGVIGGMTFVTEPAMAASVGAILFVVVVVGGTGSLAGAFAGSLIVGLLQTLPLASAASLGDAASALGWHAAAGSAWRPVLKLTLAQVAPVLPYLLLVVVLVVRPQGLFGKRDA